MGTSMTAMLVTPQDPGERPVGVTATIPRVEIEEALGSDAPLDLILEVTRPVGDRVEREEVTVAWDREDLESLLNRFESNAITLSFDADALSQALDEDFEGHGIREMLFLTVAAASASAAVAASTASGMPLDTAGGGGTAAPLVAPSAHDEATLGDRGIGVPAAPDVDVAITTAMGAATPDDVAIQTAMAAQAASGHDEATLAQRGVEPGTAASSHDEATLAARGVGVTPVVSSDDATLAARGIDPQGLPATHDEATLVSRGIEAAPVADSGARFDLPSVDPGTAAAVGGLAGAGILIAAAAFAARRQRVGTA